MAWRRASSRARFSAASMVEAELASEASGALHSGQRLANPGLSGLSSNSSSQTAQILIGKGIPTHFTTGYGPPPVFGQSIHSMGVRSGLLQREHAKVLKIRELFDEERPKYSKQVA
jgi:hypothetical protein